MTWNFMQEDNIVLIELKDDLIVDIKIESNYHRGFCETCDFGSVYVQTIEFVTRSYICETFEVEEEGGYRFSEAKLMYFLTNNLDKFEEMTREEFFELMKDLTRKRPLDLETQEIIRNLR